MKDDFSKDNSPVHRQAVGALARASTRPDISRFKEMLRPAGVLASERMAAALKLGRYGDFAGLAGTIEAARAVANNPMVEYIEKLNRSFLPKLPHMELWQHDSLGKIRDIVGRWGGPSLAPWLQLDALHGLRRLNDILPAEQLQRFESLAANAVFNGMDAAFRARMHSMANSALEILRNSDHNHASQPLQEAIREIAKEAVAAELAAAKAASTSRAAAPYLPHQKVRPTVMEVLSVIFMFLRILNELCLLAGSIAQLPSPDEVAEVAQEWMEKFEELVESPEFSASVAQTSACWTVGERHVVLRERNGPRRSRAISVLQPGQEVIVTETKKDWARVVVVAVDAEAGAVIEGWALKKYFETTCGKRVLPKSPAFSLFNT
ncbi:hypothetical protein RAS12_26900 [Achromobacter seleniivolatilans]|uniref:SH3b domain-containing protein n=1 Tax=Achromobacter seleniivolatilans TaxID=3047478 RepID=A0ABY9LZR9_9BURK|nr:hypothetical protein [Achromobacter sp. R39]WMD20195.1 hypothetical protein RAS12_26900 [Achromobacter sp. R39]